MTLRKLNFIKAWLLISRFGPSIVICDLLVTWLLAYYVTGVRLEEGRLYNPSQTTLMGWGVLKGSRVPAPNQHEPNSCTSCSQGLVYLWSWLDRCSGVDSGDMCNWQVGLRPYFNDMGTQVSAFALTTILIQHLILPTCRNDFELS